MKFPNAYQGVKKIFTAEILSLIGAACMIIFAVFGVVALAGMATASGDTALTGGIGLAVFGLAGGILSLIGLLFLMIGTKRAAQDEPIFNQAYMYILCSLILTLASLIISSIWLYGTWDNMSTTVANILAMIATIFIINGVQNLAKQLNRPDMVATGNTYMILLIVVYAVQIIVRIIPVFFGANAATSRVVGILSLAAEIVSLIVYILYLVFLGKAKKMLAEN
ncbi:MAG: hypothetical protein IKG67_14660 [Parasporobacterium sp.]|nr:hypothetical protein [Parasporobacterium sp.]